MQAPEKEDEFSGDAGLEATAEGEDGLPARKRNRLAEAERRKARAAEKLRENLLKRKQQVRARRAGEAETGIGLPASRAEEEGEGS